MKGFDWWILGLFMGLCSAVGVHVAMTWMGHTDQPPITNEVTQHCIKCHIEKGVLSGD